MKRKIVPVEPTPDMNAAGYSSMLANGKRETHLHWSAMLSASPDTTEEDVERVARAIDPPAFSKWEPNNLPGWRNVSAEWLAEVQSAAQDKARERARAALAAIMEG